MRHTIEVCCTGNNGRSPMVEVIGNNEVLEKGLEDKIIFISSGTRADNTWDNAWNYEKANSMLRRASKGGLIDPGVIDEDRYNSETHYQMVVNDLAKKALYIMRPIESALRNAALLDIGLEYKGGRTQTIVRDYVSLVLGVTSKHVRHAKEIYQGEDKVPEIMQLNEYAGVRGEISDAFGKLDPDVYRAIRDEVQKIVPVVINRFVKEHDLE
jgi:protein-tyrosine-phosphatase